MSEPFRIFHKKALRTVLFGMLYSMHPRRLYLLLMDRLQEPLPEEVSRWEDDGGMCR